jgi:hypothetical protein
VLIKTRFSFEAVVALRLTYIMENYLQKTNPTDTSLHVRPILQTHQITNPTTSVISQAVHSPVELQPR